jgi:hypothetical protein
VKMALTKATEHLTGDYIKDFNLLSRAVDLR